jgi:hypothetical protein
MVSSAAMMIGTVGGGLLATADLSAPFVLRSALLGVVLLVAIRGMHDLGFSPKALERGQIMTELRRVARVSVAYGWSEPGARLVVILTFVRNLVAAWGWYAWQPYFLALLGRDAPWVAGVIAALMSLAMMAGNGLVHRASRVCHRRTTLLGWAVALQACLLVGVGLAGSFWVAVACYLLAMVCSGVVEPVKQAYLHEVIPSQERATIISFASLAGSGGSMIGQGGLGYFSRAVSIAAAYVVGGAVVGLALPVVAALRRLGQAADRIAGTVATGKSGGCPAQGLPDVASMETSPRGHPLQVAPALVTPGEVPLAHGERLDDVVAGRARVLGVVRLLRLAAAHVPAGGAHAQVGRRPAPLAAIGTRGSCRPVEVWAAPVTHRRPPCLDPAAASRAFAAARVGFGPSEQRTPGR